MFLGRILLPLRITTRNYIYWASTMYQALVQEFHIYWLMKSLQVYEAITTNSPQITDGKTEFHQGWEISQSCFEHRFYFYFFYFLTNFYLKVCLPSLSLDIRNLFNPISASSPPHLCSFPLHICPTNMSGAWYVEFLGGEVSMKMNQLVIREHSNMS